MPREIVGIEGLHHALPSEWLLYASLNCYPRNQDPMEIDVLVVTENCVLILELKDWNGKLTNSGDLWFINGRSRGRSAVIAANEKAKKLKTVLASELPAIAARIRVESRVVLTATATKAKLSDAEKPYVLTLAEACAIADPLKKSQLLPLRTTLGLFKLYSFGSDFERVFGNSKLFQAADAEWAGYRISDQNIFVHPRNLWVEHKAEKKSDARIKGLIRVSSFASLPPTLNSQDRRRLVADRETKAFAHLAAVGSKLVENNGILREVTESASEILSDHFEVRALLAGWTTLDRFLERQRGELSAVDRVMLVTSILSLVAELHRHTIAHRDLGPRCLWVGGPSKLSVSGLMSCQLPEEGSVVDWLSTLRGYATEAPEDSTPRFVGTARQRDVYLTGLLANLVLRDECAGRDIGDSTQPLDEDFSRFDDWLSRALQNNPGDRFQDAIQMAEEFGALADAMQDSAIDASLLDRYETSTIPYQKWTTVSVLPSSTRCTVYVSNDSVGQQCIVKVWNGMLRGLNTASDLALVRLLEGVSRVMSAPAPGLPRFIECGLNPVGPYVVYIHQLGVTLNQLQNADVETLLIAAQNLIAAVNALHDLSLDHGDITLSNAVFHFETKTVCLLDPFDISPVGDDRIRTLSSCPPNWERLNQQQIDRWATIKIVFDLLTGTNVPSIESLRELLTQELERPAIETLEVAALAIQQNLIVLRRPELPSFSITHLAARDDFFKSDDTAYYISQYKINAHETRLLVTGLDAQLSMEVRNGLLATWDFHALKFSALAHASRKGARIPIKIDVVKGREAG